MAPFPGHEIALYATFAARYPNHGALINIVACRNVVQSFSTIAA